MTEPPMTPGELAIYRDRLARNAPAIVEAAKHFMNPSVVPALNAPDESPSTLFNSAEIDELMREARLEGYSAGRADGEGGCVTLDEARALLLDIEAADQLPPTLQLRITQFLSRPTH